jgi:hypothetical protein
MRFLSRAILKDGGQKLEVGSDSGEIRYAVTASISLGWEVRSRESVVRDQQFEVLT